MALDSPWGRDENPGAGLLDLNMSTPTGNPHGSLTYEPHFGLREKPFSLLPTARFFFRSAGHRAAFDALLTGIRRREGILTLTGEVGTGKTTLCRAVLEALDRKTFAAFIRDPIVSREDLLKALLVDFGVVSVDEIRGGHLRGASRTELSYPLFEFLTGLQPLDAFAVVMIDEAQNIPDALLEEIRILSDLDNGQQLLQLMLIGQPELDVRLGAPEMRQLTQRISARCDLSPLAAEDVRLYIHHRLTVAGNGNVEFNDRAIKLITNSSAGVPRMINLLCDRAMSRAAEAGASVINADHVIRATSDLKWPRNDLGSSLSRTHDSPTPVPRSDEPVRRSRVNSDLNMGDLEPRTPPPFVLEATLGQREAASEQYETPRFRQGGRPEVDPGLLYARRHSAPVPPMQRPRRRGAFLVAAAAMVLIVGAGEWLGWRYSGREQARAGQADQAESPVPAAAAPPPAPVESSAPLVPDAKPAASTPAPPLAAESVRQLRYAVQVATFTSDASAAQSVQEFIQAGFPAYSIESTLRDGVRANVVFVGPYADFTAAEQERERAQQVPGYGVGRIVPVGSASQPKATAVP